MRMVKRAGQSWRRTLAHWSPLLITGVVALVAYQVSGDPWPWLYCLGALVILLLLGVPRKYGPARALAGGLAVADVVWIAATPWWGWALFAGTLLFLAGTGLLIQRRALAPRGWQVITALVAGMALIGTGTAAWRGHVVAEHARYAHQQAQAHEDAVSRMLPTTPAGMINYLVRWIAIYPTYPDAGPNFCFPWTPTAAAAFAAALHVPDCQAGVATLARQVRDPGAYQNNLWLNASASQYLDKDTILVDACHLEVGSGDPGPAALGDFTLQQYRGGGNKITAYSPC